MLQIGQESIFDKRNLQNINNIYAINLDGTDKTLLLGDPFANSAKWTPDGKGITFSSLKNNEYGLYIKNLETGEIKLLKNGESDAKDPVWWPPQK